VFELYNKLLNNGIHAGLSFSEKNKLRVFNPAVLFVFLISFSYTLVGWFVHLPLAAYLSAFSCFCCITSIWMVNKRMYAPAFHFVMIFAFFYLEGFTLIFGLGPQSWVYFLFMQVAANILFDSLKITIKYFITVLAFLSFSLIWAHTHEPLYTDSPLNNYLFGVTNSLFAAALIFMGVRSFKKENSNYAKELEDKNAIIEEKNKSITDSINYANRIQRSLMTSEKYIEKELNRLNKEKAD
jgi:hypothetical protein